jgi:hypothetical protein
MVHFPRLLDGRFAAFIGKSKTHTPVKPFQHAPGEPFESTPVVPFEPVSPEIPRIGGKPCCRTPTLVRSSSQLQFTEKNQTVAVFDWDDTLFPTTFLERTASKSGLCLNRSVDQQTHMSEEELTDVLRNINECQASAEELLRCAQNFGRTIIVTLSTRRMLQKRCEIWYPKVWKLLNESHITIVYAIESPLASQQKDQSKLTTGYWAWLKGKAITQQLDRFYSQYKGQTWKNVISIGDSDFERYGVVGAANAYVQKRFGGATKTSESAAYVQCWQRLDSNADWSKGLEGVHEGHIFKVRTKVMKLLEGPSPTELAQELNLLVQWFPSIVSHDACLNLSLSVEDLNEKTVKSLEEKLLALEEDSTLRIHSPIHASW